MATIDSEWMNQTKLLPDENKNSYLKEIWEAENRAKNTSKTLF